jgi:hypothetical protein
MAAGSIVVYMPWLEDVLLGTLPASWTASDTYIAALVSAAYTPSAKSHSSFTADISANSVTETGYTGRPLTGLTISRPDPSHVRFDMTDVTFSASSLMDAKYVVVYRGATSRPAFYFDLETTDTSGIEATQIVVQWPANGVMQLQQAGVD